MEYKTLDSILPIMDLPDPCPIRIKITEKDVCLYIGDRDWQWDKATGEWIGEGSIVKQVDP